MTSNAGCRSHVGRRGSAWALTSFKLESRTSSVLDMVEKGKKIENLSQVRFWKLPDWGQEILVLCREMGREREGEKDQSRQLKATLSYSVSIHMYSVLLKWNHQMHS